MRIRRAVVLLPLLLVACAGSSPRASEKDYQELRASYSAPAGFTAATPAGPCAMDEHMQCWTTTALPVAAAHAALAGLGPGFKLTDTSWCSTQHWAEQRKAWGAAHTPCMLRGTIRGLQVRVEAIAFPDSKASTPGHLVFPPTLVSISALP